MVREDTRGSRFCNRTCSVVALKRTKYYEKTHEFFRLHTRAVINCQNRFSCFRIMKNRSTCNNLSVGPLLPGKFGFGQNTDKKSRTVRYNEYHINIKGLDSIYVYGYTGRARLIRSHSSARFCFELSGNLN